MKILKIHCSVKPVATTRINWNVVEHMMKCKAYAATTTRAMNSTPWVLPTVTPDGSDGEEGWLFAELRDIVLNFIIRMVPPGTYIYDISALIDGAVCKPQVRSLTMIVVPQRISSPREVYNHPENPQTELVRFRAHVSVFTNCSELISHTSKCDESCSWA